MGERLSLLPLFQAFDARAEVEGVAQAATRRGPVTAMTRHVECGTIATQMNGIARVCACRKALEALDNKGWNRSFHQRIFHEVTFIIWIHFSIIWIHFSIIFVLIFRLTGVPKELRPHIL
jgi:hypothetical protein